MRDDELLQHIHEHAWISELLLIFDFDITQVDHGPTEQVHLANGEPLEMIAGNAAGGAFMFAGALGAQHRPVVYVGSEGEGGLIATCLRDALALVVGLSALHDALAVPYEHDGARLRAWLARTDAEFREDWPEVDTARARLRTALDLPVADGLLEALHLAAADDTFRPVSQHGPYESMRRSG